jgi:predicted nucleic acid-binding protein
VDANVLINLMHVGRLDLLGRLPGYAFAVTPDVIAEIVRPDQKRQIEAALEAGTLRREELSDPTAVALFAELRPQMGAGEAATLALACQKGWAIASDEKKAFRREALARLGPGRILTTPGIYVAAIEAGLLTIEEADCDKAKLEAHRFTMAFPSFRELLAQRRKVPEH